MGSGLDRRGPVRPAAAAVLTGVALLASGACAKEEAPPGALPDQAPPRVREVRPEPGSVVPGFDGALRVRFDEPISENRGLARQMAASPTYRYRVSFGFSGFEVRPEGGWRPAVYHFVFPPPFTDLLNNQSEDTVAVTFSTGPPVTETRVTGRVRDRVTGEPVEGARATFLSSGRDSVPYGAVTGAEGRFRLPAVPPGAYSAHGFEDLNANLSLDRALEPHDSTRFELEGASDTAYLDLLLVEPDTTPPVLVTAAARDSVTVALTFDDFIAPARGLDSARVRIAPAEGGEPVAVSGLRLASRTPEGVEADTTARPDTAVRSDTLPPADTVSAPDTTAVGDTLALPDTVVVARLESPMARGTRYRVTGRGFENLRELVGGGDTTFVFAVADTTNVDTTRADTLGAGAERDPGTGGDSAPPRLDPVPARREGAPTARPLLPGRRR